MEKLVSFSKFVSHRAIWWPILIVIGLVVMTEVGLWFLFVTAGPWLGFYYSRWKKYENGSDSNLQEIRHLGFDGKILAFAICLAAIPAFFVSHAGPDHRAFYQDMPYQAAREMGYSHGQALQMRPQVLMLTNEPGGLFRTATGWFWFLSLGSLFGWRIYRFFYLRKLATTSPVGHALTDACSAESTKQPEVVTDHHLVEMKFCVACGSTIHRGDSYCGNCGHKH